MYVCIHIYTANAPLIRLFTRTLCNNQATRNEPLSLLSFDVALLFFGGDANGLLFIEWCAATKVVESTKVDPNNTFSYVVVKSYAMKKEEEKYC